jgi:hypothetical protein
VVRCDNGRKPASNSGGVRSLFSVLVAGIFWGLLPKGMSSNRTVWARLERWLALDTSPPASFFGHSEIRFVPDEMQS